MTDKMREKFEEWYGYYDFKADWRDEHGCYQDKQTQFMFAAWKAAHEEASALVEEMMDAIAHVSPRLAAKHKGSGITLNEEVEELQEVYDKAQKWMEENV